jgi:redox-sensitive bicupin YhaK (pirin superfamily)
MQITARERDLGGFSVRRILPYATHRMVGPFIFFDHMGPAEFPPGEGMEVRPHPHINLATVTYLFDGQIRHRDSLGSDQLIEPGAINWMTAGRGIVHSERTPDDRKRTGGKLNGIQCWVALPTEHEETDPSFHHHPAGTLPEFEVDGVSFKLLLGNAYGRTSPVKVHSELFYLDVRMPKGTFLVLPQDRQEAAFYLVEGQVQNETVIDALTMVIREPGQNLKVQALRDSRLMILGGENIGSRFIYWNFVSSSETKLEEAKKDWSQGPGNPGSRFPKIPGDDHDFIPLPAEAARRQNPQGTPL